MSPIPSAPSAPLAPDAAPAVPVAASSIIATDDARLDAGGSDADGEREAVYDAVHEWEGETLLPFSEARERLWMRLCAGDVPLPDVIDVANLDPYISHAVKLLFLCMHEPEQFRHLRANTGLFLETIDEWGEIHVPRAKSIAAVTLALRISNEARRSMAIPQPSDRKELGN